jgi:hypothetical protein
MLLNESETMRKIIVQIDVSLDGYTAAADGATDWIHADADMNQDASDLLDTADTILLGGCRIRRSSSTGRSRTYPRQPSTVKLPDKSTAPTKSYFRGR